MKIDSLIKSERMIIIPINNGYDGYVFEIENKEVFMKRDDQYKFEAFVDNNKVVENESNMHETIRKAIVFVLAGRTSL
tara:strand:- start:315 stop:548 length:234 start_codon:yes stop_codon:yes gene_type:complete